MANRCHGLIIQQSNCKGTCNTVYRSINTRLLTPRKYINCYYLFIIDGTAPQKNSINLFSLSLSLFLSLSLSPSSLAEIITGANRYMYNIYIYTIFIIYIIKNVNNASRLAITFNGEYLTNGALFF